MKQDEITLTDRLANGLNSSLRVLDTGRILVKNGAGLLLSSLTGKDPAVYPALRKSFEELGATYIKLGQLIASAPGLFPKELVEEMQKCLDSAAPIPFSEIKKILKTEFKNKHNHVFSSIEEIPIASASIAQVHGAKLTDGSDVVIKVQRSGISNRLEADLNLLYLAALIFEKFAPGGSRAGLTGIVQEFHRTIVEETDFYQEARHLKDFAAFLNETGEKGVMVPKVYGHASTGKVLTMERLYGVSLTDLQSIKKISKNPRDTLTLALNTWFQSLIFCGFFHADVHAGNLMVLNDGRVAFIDFGIVGKMKTEIWEALMGLVTAMGSQDYKLLAKSLVGMNATNTEVNIEQFAKELETIFNEVEQFSNDIQRKSELDEQKINNMMMELVNISQSNGLKIPREFALLFKQLLYFDRYIQILAPDMNITEAQSLPQSKIHKTLRARKKK
jgi:aarF domain-containing kinase